MASAHDRGRMLADFDAARDRFLGSWGQAPDEALRYLRAGDDYSLGGLLAHLSATLEHYGRALAGMAASGFQRASVSDPPGFADQVGARARAGLGPTERAAAVASLREAHAELAASLAEVPAESWERRLPVDFAGAGEPYDASPAEILGWVRDHYLEHVPHALELLAGWRASRA